MTRRAADRALLLPLLWTIFSASADMQVVAPILPRIAADLGVEPVRAGWLVTAYALGSAIGALAFLGRVVRIGPRRLIVDGTVILILGTIACAVAPNLALLAAARAVAGVGGGVAITMAHVYIAQAIPYERRGWAIGWLGAGFFGGTILGVPLGAALAQFVSWRGSFLALAALALPALALLRRLGPAGTPGVFAPREIPALLATRGVLPGLGAFLLLAAVISSVFTYLGLHLETAFGATPLGVASIYALGGIAAIAGGPLGGRISDRIGKRPVAVAANVAMAGLLFAATRLGTLAAAGSAAAVAHLAASIRFPAMIAMLSETVPAARRGPLLLLNHSAILVGMALGAWGGGEILAAWDFPTVGTCAAAGTAVLVGLLYRMPDPRGFPS